MGRLRVEGVDIRITIRSFLQRVGLLILGHNLIRTRAFPLAEHALSRTALHERFLPEITRLVVAVFVRNY